MGPNPMDLDAPYGDYATKTLRAESHATISTGRLSGVRIRRNGLRFMDAVAALGYRILYKCGISRYVVVVAHPHEIPRSAFDNPNSLEARFLDDAEILDVSRERPEFFSHEFATDALAKRDRCYGIFDAGRLVSSTWYSTTPTRIFGRLFVHFRPDHVYAYKSYTQAEYRGQRLHRLGGALAVQSMAQEGWKGMFAYCEASNFSSRRSGPRMGARERGNILMFRLGQRRWLLHSPGCRRIGFGFRFD